MRFGDREFSFKDGGDCSVELFVDIGVKVIDGDKFIISGRVFGVIKCYWY